MEKQYSVDFFTSFVENLQNLCQMYISYNGFVEVSGYISVEIDNFKKERYVLSEIVQASGDILSESYCTKTSQNLPNPPRKPVNTNRRALQELQTNNGSAGKRKKQFGGEQSSTKTVQFEDDEPEVVSIEVPTKVRRNNQVINQQNQEVLSVITDDIQSYHPEIQQNYEQTCLHVSNESTNINSFEQSHADMQVWTGDSSLYASNLNPSSHDKMTPRRSWHVTKEDYPSESPSNSQMDNSMLSETQQSVLPAAQVGNKIPVPKEAVEVTKLVSSWSGHTNPDQICSHQGQKLEAGSSAVSENNTLSEVVVCKQEPGLENTQDALVYTDIDDEDEGDHVDEKPVSLGISDPDRDFILIELDSDNEELSLDGSEGITDITTTDISPHDLSSYSKPQRFAVKRLIQFLEIKKIPGPVCSLPPEKLDPVLAEFYQRVRKCGGQEFGSRSLKTIQQYLEIYFRTNNYPASITKSPEFQNSRDVMTAKVRMLKNHEESSLTLKREDIDHLYACGQLGDSSPDAIINTLWLMNTVRLNIKGCKKHLELKWGDIMLQTVSDGEIIIYGGSNLYVQKNQAEPSRCFVNLYKKYWSLRPHDFLDPDSPFYLAPAKHGFKRSKYGSRIGTIFKRMLLNAGLPSDLKILNFDIL